MLAEDLIPGRVPDLIRGGRGLGLQRSGRRGAERRLVVRRSRGRRFRQRLIAVGPQGGVTIMEPASLLLQAATASGGNCVPPRYRHVRNAASACVPIAVRWVATIRNVCE